MGRFRHWDDINLLSENINTTEKNTGAFSEPDECLGLEMNA
jgi:hypothetical protein